MKPSVLLFLLFFSSSVFAQVVSKEIVIKGIYKDVDQKLSNAAIDELTAKTIRTKEPIILAIEHNPNVYNPPVLYVLSAVLFKEKKYDDAMFWFYVAQLRARYDVNRCADKTANSNEYNQNFGPQINDYAVKDLNKLEQTVRKVVAFVRVNQEKYDQRWVNLSGMDAVNAGLNNGKAPAVLSFPKNEWPAIKKKTIEEYYKGFTGMLAEQRKGK